MPTKCVSPISGGRSAVTVNTIESMGSTGYLSSRAHESYIVQDDRSCRRPHFPQFHDVCWKLSRVRDKADIRNLR